MPLYFAYGSNMDVAAMARRCPRAEAARARPARTPSARDHARGVADRGPRARARRFTGFCGTWRSPTFPPSTGTRRLARGLYVKVVQPVVAAGGAKRALVYFGANAGPGVGKPDYLAEVLAAARAAGLPADGIAALEALRLRGAGAAADRRAPRGPAAVRD